MANRRNLSAVAKSALVLNPSGVTFDLAQGRA